MLGNYDSLDKGTPSKQYKNKDGSRAATVVYKKAVDGTMYVVETVPDSKAHKMQIVTAYMTNKKTATYHQPDTTNRPKATAKTDGEFTTVNTNVARQDGKVKFSMDVPVEETKDLVAVHNVDELALERSLELGGLPMPSIAVIKAAQGHSKYGPISLVFGKDTIDPQRKASWTACWERKASTTARSATRPTPDWAIGVSPGVLY